MANVNSVSSNSYSATNSLYGNRNVLSGLASGLDTEAMIQNSVSGYSTKITQLQQKQEKLEWKQESFRDIIDEANNIASKYTSYTSKTNLMSSSFFNQFSTTTSGENASKVSATGRTKSDITINSVSQLATAARYTVAGFSGGSLAADSAINWSENVKTSSIAGSSITLKVNGEEKTVSFGADEIYESISSFNQALKSKLSEAGVNADGISYNGSTFTGAELVSATGALESKVEGTDTKTMTLSSSDLFTSTARNTYLNDKSLSVTLDGVTQSISLSGINSSGSNLTSILNNGLTSAFGAGKVTASLTDGKLTFTTASGSNSVLSIDANKELGINERLTSYLDTSKTLGDFRMVNTTAMQSLTINGVEVGSFNKDSTVQSILDAINRSGAGVSASFSSLTGQFSFTVAETGSGNRIEFGGLGQTLFGGGTFTAGKDAIFQANINGQTMNLTRSSNTIDMDGLSVTLKDTFAATGSSGVSFKTSTNADSIVSTVKSFVEDYNSLMNKLHDAFKTQPLTKNGSTYEPLTEKDKADMSESAIKSYEEKAKTGLLFGDNDLSTMYSQLNNIFTAEQLKTLGISSEFNRETGVTNLSLDEDKLKESLESDPDKVKEVFIGTEGNNGAMNKMKGILDRYASTSYGSPGILVNKAGSKKNVSSMLSNQLQKDHDKLDEQITSLQTKLSSQVDYYTRQFSLLEQMMNTMNNQSSMLAGLMGG